jgi:hypothetical protein
VPLAKKFLLNNMESNLSEFSAVGQRSVPMGSQGK